VGRRQGHYNGLRPTDVYLCLLSSHMNEPRRQRARTTKKQPKPGLSAATADKHDLYQRSVQDPEIEIGFISRVYKKTFGHMPMSLREDFCGTALFCAEWVKSHPERVAVGIDLDQPTLDWGIRHNLAAIDEPGRRVTLLRQNVLDPLSQRFDMAVALNFSYWVFTTREQMRQYFAGVLASLSPEGIFVLDAYGGPYSMEAMSEDEVERTRVKGGFTYVWDQHVVNPIDHSIVNHIHFEFKDGTKLERAFTYHWRFWTLPELTELLAEAGFSRSHIYWEDEDEDGEGTGVYRARKKANNAGAWVAYIIAEK
jgi:SAM-dependent methyltransferase